jgi:DNA-binding transcriptional ArsR family regulator
VAELLAEGYTVTEIARRLHVSKPTVCHHARRLGHSPSPKYNRRYDRSEVQRYYDAGHTVRECREHFGFANQTWNDAVKRGDVVARSRGTPLNDLLVPDRLETSRYSLKRRLFGTGLKNSPVRSAG